MLLQEIRDKDVVVVPTDKTNSFQVVHIDDQFGAPGSLLDYYSTTSQYAS